MSPEPSLEERLARLYALKAAAETLASPTTPLGQRTRQLLAETSLLSPAGIEYALSECLEQRTGRAALSQLARRATPSPRSHVLLAGNVFTAAFRAIALGLAQSPRVFVRASRRDPSMAELLAEASGHAFELVDELAPAPQDHLWAYGSTSTLAELRATLPSGVRFHGHGSGLGVIVAQRPKKQLNAALEETADLMAQDILAFDQRGCLSPRLLIVEGPREYAEMLCVELARALASWERAVPRGRLTPDEAADAARYRRTMAYVGPTFLGETGFLALDPQTDRIVFPPVGRHLHVTVTEDALGLLRTIEDQVTCIGFSHTDQLPGRCQQALGPRRYVDVGLMQKPPLDGPVDLRIGSEFEVL